MYVSILGPNPSCNTMFQVRKIKAKSRQWVSTMYFRSTQLGRQ